MDRYFFFRGLKSMMVGLSSRMFRMASPKVRQPGSRPRPPSNKDGSLCGSAGLQWVGSGKSISQLNRFPMKSALSRS